MCRVGESKPGFHQKEDALRQAILQGNGRTRHRMDTGVGTRLRATGGR